MAEDSSIYSTIGEGSERAVPLATLHFRQVRLVYLITYSQADLDLVPTREEFSAIVLDSFSNSSEPCISAASRAVSWKRSSEVSTSGRRTSRKERNSVSIFDVSKIAV